MKEIRANKRVRNVLLLFLLATAAADAAWIGLYANEYALSWMNRNAIEAIAIYHFVLLIGLVFACGGPWTAIIAVPCACLFAGLIVYMHFSLSSGWIYRQWDAPDGHDSITIRYREATLGESRFFYEVYRSAGGGGWLLKHLPREDFEVTVRAGEPAGGIRNVQWADESTLQFDVQGERRSISLY